MATRRRSEADLHVLLVDDDADIRRMVKFALQGIGIDNIELASDGTNAWSKFRESAHRFDLIISDWMMPDMDGAELLKRIRQSGSAVPFLMLTVKATGKDVSDAAKAGVTAFVAKPFVIDDLQKRVKALARKILADAESV